MTREDFIRKARAIHRDKYDYSLVDYVNYKTKVKIICPIHGAFEQTPNNHLNKKIIHGCPRCGIERRANADRKYSIGDKFKNKYGEYEICDIISYKRTKVRFIETNTIVEASMTNIILGNVKDFRKDNVQGFGSIGVKRERDVSNRGEKSYIIWSSMLKRCYNESYHKVYPTYQECYVSESWKCYINFKEWFDKHYVEGYCLDKDILFKGNKMYSAETCCFVPNEINCLFLRKQRNRGKYPLGVTITDSGRFAARFLKERRIRYLGVFDTPEEAFQAYKVAKEVWIKEVANKWKGKIADNVYKAMMNYEVEITD